MAPVPTRFVLLYSDYDGSPLFGGNQLHPITGADLGLSAELTARIDAWQALFAAEHLGGHEWRSDGAAATYEREGCAIVDALVAELPGFVIKYSLWPVGEPGGYAGGWTRGWSPSGETPLPEGTEVRQFDSARERWIRMMSDYSSPPLWGTSGGFGPEHLNLPEDLGAALGAWQAMFDREVHWETGWSSDAARSSYRTEGHRLLPLVAAELPGHVVELIVGSERTYAGAWVDGWLPALPDTYWE